MKGKRIKSIKRVCELALERKCIVHDYPMTGEHRIPAAFVQNYMASFLQRYIDNGWIYEYKAKPISKSKPKKNTGIVTGHMLYKRIDEQYAKDVADGKIKIAKVEALISPQNQKLFNEMMSNKKKPKRRTKK